MPPDKSTSSFYETPNPVEDAPQEGGIALPLTRARRVTRNHVVAFSLIILMVLGLALWLVVQEKPLKRMVEARQRAQREEVALKEDVVTNSIEEVSKLAIQLYDGPYILDFMPETAKKEGLSLFYVFSQKEKPFSANFRVREDVLRKVQPEVSQASLEYAPLRREVEVRTSRLPSSDVKLSRTEVYLKIARRQIASGSYRKAAVTLERILEKDVEHVETLEVLLSVRLELEAYDDAILLFERLDERDALEGSALNDYGVTLARVGRFEEADVFFERAYTLSGEGARGGLNWALNCLVLSKWDRAIEVLEVLLQRDPEDADARLHLAYARLGGGQYDVARDDARRYLLLRPEAVDGVWVMAESYAFEGAVVEALRWLKRVREKMELAAFSRSVKKRPAFKRVQEVSEFQALLK